MSTSSPVVAICPGSYDPVTYGHVDIIRRAAEIFDRVVVGVVRDPAHKGTMWEFQMNHLNRTLAPDIETLYVMASPQYSFVSSSGVKEIASFGGAVDELVPPAVAKRFRDLFPEGRPGAPVSPRE